MSHRIRILERFAATAEDGSAPLLLDLTLWHKWHIDRGTLPTGWGSTLIDAAKAFGTPVWAPYKPWRVLYEGVEVYTEESAGQRDIVYRTPGRTLVARWTKGPDGDWWQTDYPVGTMEDLEAALHVAAARRYVLETDGLAEWRAAVGEAGVVPLELPMRPYSDLLHAFVGWGAGMLLLMGEGKPLVVQILQHLEQALASLVAEIVALDGDLLLAADNLDGQYVSPRVFKEFLLGSYRQTVEAAGAKPVVVHVGGPARRMVPLLAEAGVAGIEGIAGPPQSDITLTEARALTGPAITLWGGVSQDLLIDEHDDEAFERGVRAAMQESAGDARMILGVADRVPAQASLDRLQRLIDLTE